MTLDPRTPVIAGAGQISARERPGGSFPEPVTLIEEAARAAAADSGAGPRLLGAVESVRAVAVAGWRYGDAGALLASDLGIAPHETVQTNMFGGDGPQRLVAETAQEIQDGRLEVALVAGGEAVASLLAAQRAGADPGWRTQPEGTAPTRLAGVDRAPVNAAEAAAGLAAPIDFYALLETALAAGTDRSAHLDAIAGLWARGSEVASKNPYAWLPRRHTPGEILASRRVSHPYTKLLCANIQVDQAAALLLCSAGAAQRLGVPHERWVFVHAAAQAQDTWHVSERATLTASPAIAAAGAAALAHAGLDIDQVGHLDLYSCFPSAVQLGAAALGLALDDAARPLTLTGGLTFAGGPGNNYSTHGIAALVGRLREHPEDYGLASALGWYATKHALGIYSARAPRRPFAWLSPRVEAAPERRALARYEGRATLEAYTVRRDRDEQPTDAVVFALTPAGDRAVARIEDAEAVRTLLEHDAVGREVALDRGALTLR